MRLLIPYLVRYRRELGLALCMAALGQLCTVVDPLVVRYAIDTYATHAAAYGTAQFVRDAGALMAGAAVIALAARGAERTREYFVSVVVLHVGADLFADGMERSLNPDHPLLEAQESGAVVGVLQTTRADVQRFIAVAVNVVFTSGVGLLFLGVLAYRAHWLLIPAVLLVVPVTGALGGSLGHRIRALQTAIVAESAALASASTEALRNTEIVQSLGATAQFAARLRAMTAELLELELRKARCVRALGTLSGSGVTLLRSVLLFAMVYLLYLGRITLGDCFALALYAGFVFLPLRELGGTAGVFRETQASLARLADILGAAPRDGSLHDAPGERTAVAGASRMTRPSSIEFDDVTFQHRLASRPALSGVTFSLSRGEIVALVGPSGAGKSTVLRLLLGLYQPVCGTIRYDGAPASSDDLKLLRQSAGIITQDTQLFAGSLRENLCVARPGASDAQCIQALCRAGAESLLLRGGAGLSAIIGEGGMMLSGGERQRIAIARALLREPFLLLVDEATASLDSIAEREISDTIRGLTRRRDGIGVVIAHRLATVMYADRIHVLASGRLVETGTHSQLVALDGVYAAMWQHQTGAAAVLRGPSHPARAPQRFTAAQ